MPLVLDPSLERARASATTKPDYINGVPLNLTAAQHSEVLYVKYVNINPYRCDFQPAGEWEEEFGADISKNVDRPRLIFKGPDGSVPLRDDHGLIIRTKGKPVGIFCLTDTGMLTEEQAEALEEVQQRTFERFQKWEFTIKHVLKTDGPERRLRLQMSNEQRKEDEKSEMFVAFKEMFRSMAQNGTAPAGMAMPNDPFAGMEVEQIAAILELKRAEQDDKERLAQESAASLAANLQGDEHGDGQQQLQGVSQEPDSAAKGQVMAPQPARQYVPGQPLNPQKKNK